MSDRILNQFQFNQQLHYINTGYIKLSKVINQGQLDALRRFVYEQKDIQVTEGNHKAKIYGLYERDPELMHALITQPKLVETLKNLLGPGVIFVKNRHNQAAINSRQDTVTEARLHRDILQPTRGLLTAAIYLEDSSIENGATNVIPGSHLFPSVGMPQPKGGGTWMDEHEEYQGLEDQAVPIIMKAGDILLFNGTLFHSVGKNTTNTSRTSIILGFRSIDELDALPDESRQIIITGSQTYRGNDKN